MWVIQLQNQESNRCNHESPKELTLEYWRHDLLVELQNQDIKRGASFKKLSW